MWEIIVALLGIVFIFGLIQSFTKPKIKQKAKRVNVYTKEQKEHLRRYNKQLWDECEYVSDAMGLRKNLYRWQCTVCGRIYYHRWEAQYCNHGQTLLSKIKSYFDKK